MTFNQIYKQNKFGVIKYTLFQDGTDNIQVLSDSLEIIWGFSRGEIEKSTSSVWDNIDKEYLQNVKDQVNISKDTLNTYKCEYLYHINKQTKWIQETGFPERNSDGSTTWVITVEDITAQKYNNEDRDKIHLQYDILLNVVQDAVVTINENHKIISFNKAAEAMFKYNSYEVIGKPLNILIPKKYHDTHTKLIHNFKNSIEKIRVMGEFIVVKGINSESEEFEVSASIGKTTYNKETNFMVVLRHK